MRFLIAALLVLVLATSVVGLEKKAFQMREDFGTEPLWASYMNYYYYIPCPTYSWFWMYTGWEPGDLIGAFFTVGDPSMYVSKCPPPYPPYVYTRSDPYNDHTLEQFRVLDFAGYGTIYPGLFTVDFNIWCADEYGCPVGPSLWNSGPTELCVGGWNYIVVTPYLCLTPCHSENFPPWGYPRILITAKMIGSNATYPAWGMDNISTPVTFPCVMHDYGCCPALYPRPFVSHYARMHSGYYGNCGFQYCPPLWFLDGRDSTGYVYGFIELAWRIYLGRTGPTGVEPSTWGNIKAMYR